MGTPQKVIEWFDEQKIPHRDLADESIAAKVKHLNADFVGIVECETAGVSSLALIESSLVLAIHHRLIFFPRQECPCVLFFIVSYNSQSMRTPATKYRASAKVH